MHVFRAYTLRLTVYGLHTLYGCIGGSRGCARCKPPRMGPNSFILKFCIHFHQKAPALEVHAPPNECTPPPPTGNPGSATGLNITLIGVEGYVKGYELTMQGV